jgi:hypothetical protein
MLRLGGRDFPQDYLNMAIAQRCVESTPHPTIEMNNYYSSDALSIYWIDRVRMGEPFWLGGGT